MTSSDILISIVIVNFNGGDTVMKCIHSCVCIPLVKKIIISDNGSTDGSLENLKIIQSDYPHILILENEKNLGFSRGNNRALPHLNTPYTLFLNPDTEITEAAISRMVQVMEANNTIGMCGPIIRNNDGSEQRGCRRSEPTPIQALKTLVGNREKGINQVGASLPEHPTKVDAISGACMLVRKEALNDVGPMDEGYFLHCEDLDWCKRFWLKGWKVKFVPDAIVRHYKGGSSRKRPIRVEWHKHAGMVRYYSKFYKDEYPKPLMWLVYSAVWARFTLMTPIWWIKGLLA